MAGKDVNSVTRNMNEFISEAGGMLRREGLEPDTVSVTMLAVTMFNDYRGNTPRGVAELKATEKGELLILERKLFGRRGRRR